MTPRSYFGVIRAGTGTLLGGVKAHTTSRLEREEDAKRLVEVLCTGNREAGRDVAFSCVYASERAPEIAAVERGDSQ